MYSPIDQKESNKVLVDGQNLIEEKQKKMLEAFKHSSIKEQLKVFDSLSPNQEVFFFSALSFAQQLSLFSALSTTQQGFLFSRLSEAQQNHLLGNLSEEQRQYFLQWRIREFDVQIHEQRRIRAITARDDFKNSSDEPLLKPLKSLREELMEAQSSILDETESKQQSKKQSKKKKTKEGKQEVSEARVLTSLSNHSSSSPSDSSFFSPSPLLPVEARYQNVGDETFSINGDASQSSSSSSSSASSSFHRGSSSPLLPCPEIENKDKKRNVSTSENRLYYFLQAEPHLLHAILLPCLCRGGIDDGNTPTGQQRPSPSGCIWLYGSSYPIKNSRRLPRVINTIHFLEGIQTITGGVWPLLLTGLLTHDLIQYLRLSDYRYGNNLSSIFFGYPAIYFTEAISSQRHFNQNIWSGFFDAQDVMSGYGHWWAAGLLLGVPLLSGLVHWLRHLGYMQSITSATTPDSYQTYVDENSVCPGFGHHWHLTTLRLLWNGNISEDEKKELVRQLVSYAEGTSRANRWDRLRALYTLAELVNHESSEDFKRVHRSDGQQWRQAIYRSDAIQGLLHLARDSREKDRDAHEPAPKFYYLFANYLLWTLGFLEGRRRVVLEPLFWLYKTYLVYAQYRYWERVIVNFQQGKEDFDHQRQCEREGKQWGVHPEIGEAECSICGDWPVYIGDIQSSEKCWQGFLAKPHTPEEIVNAAERFCGHADIIPPRFVDFTCQNWADWTLKQWSQVLDALSGFGALERFDLSRPTPNIHWIEDDKMNSLARFLRRTPTKQVILHNQRMSDEAFKELSRGISQNTTTALDLSDTAMRDTGAASIASELPTSHVTELNVAGNYIADEGVEKIANAISNSSVQTVDLSNNQFGPTGCSELFRRIARRPLSHLDLSSQDLTVCDMHQIGAGLNGIHSLVMSDARLGDSQLLIFSSYLLNSTLQWLDISHNPVTERSMLSLVTQMGSYLTSLNLNDNNLTDKVLEQLGKYGLLYLEELDITNNSFGSDAFIQWVNALKGSSIRVLKIGNNRLGGAAMMALAQVVPHMPNLEWLDASLNQIQTAGAQALLEALNTTQLHTLILSHNNIDDGIEPVLKQAILSSHLTALDIRDNYLSCPTFRAITSALKRSALQTLDMSHNLIQGECLVSIGHDLLASDPLMHPDSFSGPSLNRDERWVLHTRARPATHLTQLGLSANKLTRESARALCRVWPAAQNDIRNLHLDEYPIDANQVDIRTCQISAASPRYAWNGYSKAFGFFASSTRGGTSSGSLPFILVIVGGIMFLYWLLTPGIRFMNAWTPCDEHASQKRQSSLGPV